MISVSLVSHGHGRMVWQLVDQLVVCPEVTQVIVTLNIPEPCTTILHDKVYLVTNDYPKGFGANHNAAFALAHGEFYCVINPDIELTSNPFGSLVEVLNDQNVGLVAPLVVGYTDFPEDSMRRFITPLSMVKRVLGIDSGAYYSQKNEINIEPDWVAGMFMLFRSEAYAKVGGFDKRYFMYCEDTDICTRLWKLRYKVVGCLSVRVKHNAQRASRKSLKHFIWHLKSMLRYFCLNYSNREREVHTKGM